MLSACLLLGLLPPASVPSPRHPQTQDPSPRYPPAQDPATHRASFLVVGEDDRPLADVPVAVNAHLGIAPNSFPPRLETDAEGRCEVAWRVSGPLYYLDVVLGGDGLEKQVRSLGGGPEPSVRELERLKLAPASPLEFRILDESGASLADVASVRFAFSEQDRRPAQHDAGLDLFRVEDVPRGSFEVEVFRVGDPWPCCVTRLEQDGSGTVRTVTVESRRQVWVHLHPPWPDSLDFPDSLYQQLVVRATDARGAEVEAEVLAPYEWFVFDGLPPGPLDLRVEGPRELRPFEARLEGRGLVDAYLRGSLDLEVVLRERGSTGPIGDFDVRASVDRVDVTDLPGRAGKLVTGLVPWRGNLELELPGSGRPPVRIDLAELTPAERRARRVERTLPIWSALGGRLVDRTGASSSGAGPRGSAETVGTHVQVLVVDGAGEERVVQERRDLEPGSTFEFAGLVSGAYVLRVWWAPRDWQDFPVRLEGESTRLDVVRRPPARLELVHAGAWPAAFGLAVHPLATPRGVAPSAGVPPSGAGRFGPFEVAPGEVLLSLALEGSRRSLPFESFTVEPGYQRREIDLGRLPALVRWSVRVDGESVVGGTRGDVNPLDAGAGGGPALRFGVGGAREDRLLVPAVDSELVLKGEDGTWCRVVELKGLQPGGVRELEVDVTRVRRRVRFLVDGRPCGARDVRVELQTPTGILLKRTVATDAAGTADLAFVAGTLTARIPALRTDPASLDWSERLLEETVDVVLR